jgi:hypothetical protein
MKLVFCLSNLFIPSTISLINENSEIRILLYTDQKGIYDFFKIMNFKNVKLYFNNNISLSKNPFKYIFTRHKVLKEFQKKDFSEIYFFHNAFGSFENYLISKLSSTIKVYHCPVIKSLPFEKRKSLKSYIGKTISKLIYNTEVTPLWIGERYTYKLSDSFFKKINSNKKKIIIDNLFINKIVEERFKIKNINNILLLVGGIVELGHVSKGEYESKIDALINTIGKEHIACKPHPRYDERYSRESELELIHSYIPANVLFSKFKIFIGYSTTVLTESANNGLTAISLIDYLVPTSLERKRIYKDYLKNNLDSGIIHFPQTLEEIISLIKNNNP